MKSFLFVPAALASVLMLTAPAEPPQPSRRIDGRVFGR